VKAHDGLGGGASIYASDPQRFVSWCALSIELTLIVVQVERM
jgi:hypothetical protein